MLFKHILNLSLNFHLQRETGKLLRIVNKGSASFGDLVRMIVLQFLPLMFLVIFYQVILYLETPYYVGLCCASSILIYIIASVQISEWRAKTFKELN